MRDDKRARKRCPALSPELMRYRIPGLTPGDLRPDPDVVPSGIRRAFFRPFTGPFLGGYAICPLKFQRDNNVGAGFPRPIASMMDVGGENPPLRCWALSYSKTIWHMPQGNGVRSQRWAEDVWKFCDDK